MQWMPLSPPHQGTSTGGGGGIQSSSEGVGGRGHPVRGGGGDLVDGMEEGVSQRGSAASTCGGTLPLAISTSRHSLGILITSYL